MRFDESRPIWAQLVTEFRRRIAAGEWAPGKRVPAVRELALELGVNPNTVQRALTEVDRLGLTTTERTAGRFVTDDAGALTGARAELAENTADSYVREASGIGMTLAEAQDLIATRWALTARAEGDRADPHSESPKNHGATPQQHSATPQQHSDAPQQHGVESAEDSTSRKDGQ